MKPIRAINPELEHYLFFLDVNFLVYNEHEYSSLLNATKLP